MALTKCSSTVAANAAISCTEPILHGLSDNGVGIPFEACTFTRDGSNPRKITAITIAAGTTAFAIYNPSQNPFADSGTEVNLEGAMVKYNKTLNFTVPILNADGSMNVVEPLSKNRAGFVFIIPTKQKTADGGFVIIGSELGATMTAGTRNLTDPASSAAFSATMTETGANYETVCLTGATYAAAKVTYDALLAGVF